MTHKIMGIALVLLGTGVAVETIYEISKYGATMFRIFMMIFSVYVLLRGIWRLRSPR